MHNIKSTYWFIVDTHFDFAKYVELYIWSILSYVSLIHAFNKLHSKCSCSKNHNAELCKLIFNAIQMVVFYVLISNKDSKYQEVLSVHIRRCKSFDKTCLSKCISNNFVFFI